MVQMGDEMIVAKAPAVLRKNKPDASSGADEVDRLMSRLLFIILGALVLQNLDSFSFCQHAR